MTGDPHTPNSDETTRPPAGEPGADLAMLLTGDLPCIGCGYDIRGLSVLSQCSECGLAVRATILHSVDPQADALLPMPTPWLTSVGILVWTAAGFLAAMTMWLPRGGDLLEEFSMGRVSIAVPWAGPLAIVLIMISGAGLLGVIHPAVGLGRVRIAMAVVATACYFPIGYALYRINDLGQGAAPYLGSDPIPGRIGWRLAAAAAACAMLLLIRPNARELVNRSLVLRTKRVDRQTILATVGALGVASLGDGLRLVSVRGGGTVEWIEGIGSLLVLVGSALVTVAIAGAVRDSWRIAHSILAPSPSPSQALRRGTR